MAFKFIIGPNGYDKTAKCMDLMKKCLSNYNRIYYFVPEAGLGNPDLGVFHIQNYLSNKNSTLFKRYLLLLLILPHLENNL